MLIFWCGLAPFKHNTWCHFGLIWILSWKLLGCNQHNLLSCSWSWLKGLKVFCFFLTKPAQILTSLVSNWDIFYSCQKMYANSYSVQIWFLHLRFPFAASDKLCVCARYSNSIQYPFFCKISRAYTK